MRTALALVMLLSGIVAVRSAFAQNPDPRVVLGRIFGVPTSGLTLINDPGPTFGLLPGETDARLSLENLDRVIGRAPTSTRTPLDGRQLP